MRDSLASWSCHHPEESYPVSSNGQWFSGVEVLPTVKDRFLVDKIVCMALDQGLYYLPVDSAWTLVRNDGYIIVVEDTVWNLHLQGGLPWSNTPTSHNKTTGKGSHITVSINSRCTWKWLALSRMGRPILPKLGLNGGWKSGGGAGPGGVWGGRMRGSWEGGETGDGGGQIAITAGRREVIGWK